MKNVNKFLFCVGFNYSIIYWMLRIYVLVHDKNSLHSFMHVIHHLHVHALLLIMHHCICVETNTLEFEEGEPAQEPVVDDTPLESQGRHLSIFSTLFWIHDLCVLFVHKLILYIRYLDPT
jgi:hypothetical protein